MVKAVQADFVEIMQWGGFLALALALNLYALSLVKLPVPHIDLPNVNKIRIAFMSLAAPKATPVSLKHVAHKQAREVTGKTAKVAVVPNLVSTTPIPVKTAKVADRQIAQQSTPVHKKTIARSNIPTPRLSVKKPTPLKAENLLSKVSPPIEPVKVARPVKPVPVKVVKNAHKSVANNRGSQISTVIHKANYRRRTPPSYPRRAYELGQQGLVLLHALVAVDGLAKQLKLKTSSGHRMLDRAALAAVKKWEFEPPIQNGQKIQSWISVPVRFVIQ